MIKVKKLNTSIHKKPIEVKNIFKDNCLKIFTGFETSPGLTIDSHYDCTNIWILFLLCLYAVHVLCAMFMSFKSYSCFFQVNLEFEKTGDDLHMHYPITVATVPFRIPNATQPTIHYGKSTFH